MRHSHLLRRRIVLRLGRDSVYPALHILIAAVKFAEAGGIGKAGIEESVK